MMKYLPLFLLLASCASVSDQYSKGVDQVSCRMDCRQLQKVVDTSKASCVCISEKKDDTLDVLLKKLDSLEKKIESQKEPVCLPADFSSREITPPHTPKKPSGDPLLDILNE